MKIIVNDNILDTENIKYISEICFKELRYSFVINHFNGGKIEIVSTIKDLDNNMDFRNLFRDYKYAEIKEEEYIAKVKQLPQWKISLEEITKFRDDIVVVWSNNQTNIPKFNLK